MSEESQDKVLAAGASLKEARERAGLSISDVATSTKISVRALQALEDGELDKLPAKSFTRGFIRTYSQYLKLDPQPIIEAYDMDDPFLSTLGKEVAESSKRAKQTTDETPPSERISGLPTDRNLAKPVLVAAIIVLIFLVVGIKKVVDRYSQETVLPTTVATESGTQILAPSKDDDGEDSVTATDDVEATSAAESETPAAVANAVPTAAPVAVPSLAPTAPPAVAPTVAPAAKPTPAPTKAAEAVAATSQQVVIEALDKVAVSIRVDGQKAAKMSLAPGSVHTINAAKTVELEVADGGLVNVIVNGKDIGSAGDLGSPATLKFPRK